MIINKQKIDSLNRCYAVSHTYIDGSLKVLFASEGEDKCIMYGGKDFKQESVVWEKPGGTMSIVFIPGRPDEFLAVQKFLPTFQAEKACLIHGKYKDGKWEINHFVDFPYLHRFDIISRGGANYLLCCTLATSKKYKDDWSDPGKVYAAKIDDLSKPPVFEILKDGMVKNHGYCRGEYKGNTAGYASSASGIFAFIPPLKDEKWEVVEIFNKPVSDMAFVDIDSDGDIEMATIEEFHGKFFRIYKKDPEGVYKMVYEYPQDREFGHVVWGGKLRGEPVFIGGFRRPVKDMFYIRCKSKAPLEFEAVTLELEGGPSNIDVVNEDDKDLIFTANREAGEASVYIVTK